MFTLQDGREHLYQWDVNRKVIVDDTTIAEVHFCNKTDDCSLVVNAYWEDGSYVADIPNILLQNDFPIRVYAYCNDGYTKIEETFKVKSRTKPSDYIYTETEVITVQTIEKRMDELEDSLSTNIERTVAEYFEENPVEVDLSNYYNKAETNAAIDKAIEGIEIPSLDGYATEKYVDDAIANIDIPEGDGSKVYVINSPTISGAIPITDELIEIYNKVAAGEPVVCYWLVDSLSNNYYPTTLMYRVMDEYSYVQIEPSHISYSAGSYFKIGGTRSYVSIELTGDTYTASYYRGSSGDSYDIPTKQYVDDAIQTALSGIATAEGGSY